MKITRPYISTYMFGVSVPGVVVCCLIFFETRNLHGSKRTFRSPTYHWRFRNSKYNWVKVQSSAVDPVAKPQIDDVHRTKFYSRWMKASKGHQGTLKRLKTTKKLRNHIYAQEFKLYRVYFCIIFAILIKLETPYKSPNLEQQNSFKYVKYSKQKNTEPKNNLKGNQFWRGTFSTSRLVGKNCYMFGCKQNKNYQNHMCVVFPHKFAVEVKTSLSPR